MNNTTLALALLVLLAGCGALDSRCAATCDKLYAENECNLQSPGATREDLMEKCMEVCREASRTSGEASPGYEPFEYTPSYDGEQRMQTRGDVKLWAECVEETACDLLGSGYCSPVW